MQDELIYKLMGELQEALNRKANSITDAEHDVAIAIGKAFMTRRIELKEAPRAR